MKLTTLILFVFLINVNLYGQTRTCFGRVISEDLEILPGVKIFNSDTILLGNTDREGRFEI